MTSDKKTIVPKIVARRWVVDLGHLAAVLLAAVIVPLSVIAACQVVTCRDAHPTWDTVKCLAPHALQEVGP